MKADERTCDCGRRINLHPRGDWCPQCDVCRCGAPYWADADECDCFRSQWRQQQEEETL